MLKGYYLGYNLSLHGWGHALDVDQAESVVTFLYNTITI